METLLQREYPHMFSAAGGSGALISIADGTLFGGSVRGAKQRVAAVAAEISDDYLGYLRYWEKCIYIYIFIEDMSHTYIYIYTHMYIYMYT